MNLSQAPTTKAEVRSVAENYYLTPTMERILHKLSDGKQHSMKELLSTLDDKMSESNSLKVIICRMRRLLRERGEDIAMERCFDRTWYRWVRIIRTTD